MWRFAGLATVGAALFLVTGGAAPEPAQIAALALGGVAIGTLPTICPKGTGFPDGCSGAPAGVSAQLPTLLNGYAARPAWNVAAVDYGVGIPAGTTLTDPGSTGQNLPACVSANSTSHVISVQLNNCTLNAFDFSLEGGWAILIPSGISGTIIKNSNLKIGTNAQYLINSPSGSGSLTIENCVIDGNGTNDTSSFQDALNYSGSGTVTIEYNIIKNTWQHGIDWGGLSTTPIVKYNLFQNIGIGTGGVHPDPWYNFNAGLTGGSLDYNTIYEQGSLFTAGNPGIWMQTDNSATRGSQTNMDMSSNTVVCVSNGSGIPCSYGLAFQIGTASTSMSGDTVNTNYVDPGTGAFGFWNSPSNPCSSGCSTLNNVNMVTGLVVKSPWSN